MSLPASLPGVRPKLRGELWGFDKPKRPPKGSMQTMEYVDAAEETIVTRDINLPGPTTHRRKGAQPSGAQQQSSPSGGQGFTPFARIRFSNAL